MASPTSPASSTTPSSSNTTSCSGMTFLRAMRAQINRKETKTERNLQTSPLRQERSATRTVPTNSCTTLPTALRPHSGSRKPLTSTRSTGSRATRNHAAARPSPMVGPSPMASRLLLCSLPKNILPCQKLSTERSSSEGNTATVPKLNSENAVQWSLGRKNSGKPHLKTQATRPGNQITETKAEGTPDSPCTVTAAQTNHPQQTGNSP